MNGEYQVGDIANGILLINPAYMAVDVWMDNIGPGSVLLVTDINKAARFVPFKPDADADLVGIVAGWISDGE